LKLVPFQHQYLRLGDPLPFGLRDADGRLLLAAGHAVPNAGRLDDLKGQPLFAEESESAAWYRRLAVAVGQALRQGQSLQAVAAARPESLTPGDNSAQAQQPADWGDLWDEVVSQLEQTLRHAPAEADWRSRLDGVHGRARGLLQRRPDATLYCLAHESMHNAAHYTARHALLVMCIAEQAAAVLGWPQAWIDSLGRAALLLDVSIAKAQDQQALAKLPASPALATELANHPAASAAMLTAGGLDDGLCIEAVRQHHLAAPPAPPLAERAPAQQLAELLRRVDGFTTAFSRNGPRAPGSPLQAMREWGLLPGGKADELAGALLKAVGLYPPGCFVELVGGELAVVLARGPRANQPRVAALVGASGLPLLEPAVRDTADARYAVKGPVAAQAVKVRPPHAKLLALR
jgi:hypothetical protein